MKDLSKLDLAIRLLEKICVMLAKRGDTLLIVDLMFIIALLKKVPT